MANGVVQAARLSVPRRRRSGRRLARHKSTIAFLMALPLIALIAALVIYPALYSLHLATLNKSMERFVGLGDRKSTRLNSSHSQISYAVFCLKKKKEKPHRQPP